MQNLDQVERIESDSPDVPRTSWIKAASNRVELEWDTFWEAFFASYGRVLLGVTLGYVCIEAAFKLQASGYPHRASLAEHFGVAFFVAAIVVFGYEWKSDRKSLLEAVSSMTRALNAQHRVGAIRCAREMFAGKDNLQVSLGSGLEQLLIESHELVSKNAWSRKISIGLVRALIASATENAHKFANPEEGDTGFRIELPSPAALVEKMLETQMASMQESGTYEVISDFTSFQKMQLKDFMLVTKERVKKGVTVRRIFVCFDHDFDLPLDEMERIVNEHWSAVAECDGKYVVGFIEPRRSGIDPPHEGVFTQGELRIRFRPKAPDLHVMEFFRDSAASGITDAFDKLAKLAVFAGVGRDNQADRSKYLASVRKAWKQAPRKSRKTISP